MSIESAGKRGPGSDCCASSMPCRRRRVPSPASNEGHQLLASRLYAHGMPLLWQAQLIYAYASADADDSLTVEPRERVTRDYWGCLNETIFSVRLVDETSAHANKSFIMPVGPLEFSTRTGAFHARVDGRQFLPPGKHEVEVILELGNLQGATRGQVCDDDVEWCTIRLAHGRVLQQTRAAHNFTGRPLATFPVPPLAGAKSSVISAVIFSLGLTSCERLAEPFDLSTVTRTCSALSPIHSFWYKEQFYGVEGGRPCRLHDASVNPGRDLPPVIWINFVGDSNSRKTITAISQFRVHPQAQAVIARGREGEEQAGGAVGILQVGEVPGTNTIVIFSWRWWYQRINDEWDANIAELTRLVDVSLPTMLANSRLEEELSRLPLSSPLRSMMARVLSGHADLVQRPTLTAISLGSHDPETTHTGLDRYLDIVFSPDHLSPQLVKSANVFFQTQTTTTVDAAMIPMRRNMQWLIRNNMGRAILLASSSGAC